MSFAAGMYTNTLNASSMGQTGDDMAISHQEFGENVIGHNHGLAPQDRIYLGEEVFFEATLLEWDTADAIDAFWWASSTYLTGGIPGRAYVQQNLTEQLVLTVLAGTAAATGGPASITMAECTLAEGFPVRHLFTPNHRRTAVRFRVFPSSSYVYGTVT